MAETYGPFNSGAGANFLQQQWRELFGTLFSSGVIKNALVNGSAGGNLAVTIASGLTVNIASGIANAYGFFYENDGLTQLQKTLANADPTNPRIDYVIIQMLFASNTVLCAVKTGTPAGSPNPPALTQNATEWDIPLATCRVNAGASTIASVTDQRAYVGLQMNPTVMGPGSGLNADLLDGVNSSSFTQIGSHSSTSYTLSAGSGPPGALAAGEIYVQLT